MHDLVMCDSRIETLKGAVRDVPDFPKEGILFKDITPILADPTLFRQSIDLIADEVAVLQPDKVLGVDARGFIFGAAVAYRLQLGLIVARKVGKLPWRTYRTSYALEYGEAEIEIHTDSAAPGERIVLVDDLLATGGTSRASLELIRSAGAVSAGAVFLIELGFLEGRKALAGETVRSMLVY